MKCSACGKTVETKGARVPSGWKKHPSDGAVFCNQCWRERFVLRAVTFPVIGPVDGTWEELRSALAGCWAESTALANWTATELVKNDVQRKAGDKKCPKMPAIYLYGHAKKRYSGWKAWAGSALSACSLMRAVEAKYRKQRYDIVWTRAASLPTFRYPFPFPFHNQSWTAAFDEGNRPVVTLPLGGRRWTLLLKGGAEMARQLGQFRQIVSGAAVCGEAAIYRVSAGTSDHRNGTNESGEGGPRQHSRVMVKLVAWLPRPAKSEATKTMLVRTDPCAFWVAEVEGAAPWILNADHVRQWQAEHAVYRQRIAEDTKYEKRWPKRKRQQINAARERRCTKNNNRLATWIGQASALIANYAARQGVCEVIYDDGNRSYLPSFPWRRLADAVACKLDERHISFTTATKQKDEEAA